MERVWEDAQNTAIYLKATAQEQLASATVGNVQSSVILAFEAVLRGVRDQLNDAAAVPGIAAYVGSLPNTPQGYNVATEFTALRTQILATIDWIRTNFPKDSTNTFLAARSWAADGPVDRLFSAAQLATYRTQLSALITAAG